MSGPRLDIRPGLSALLGALGFDAMARDVRTETDPKRLDRYARIARKQAPPELLPRLDALMARSGYRTGPPAA